jgi:hypothetical protein
MVRPVAEQYFMTDAELAEEKKIAHEKSIAEVSNQADANIKHNLVLATLAWMCVLVPISYGVWSTVQKAWVLFSSI